MMHIAPYTGYVYPNETIIPWTLLIAIYPYLTGLVAGAFTVSSMHHAFGMERFKPVARFALLISLSCMIFVPLPLILHLGHPERAMNAMITPHLSSAFAMFGFFAAFYVVLLMLECWFVFRADERTTRQDWSSNSIVLSRCGPTMFPPRRVSTIENGCWRWPSLVFPAPTVCTATWDSFTAH
jgi:Ni/Fe-hydrogenase subunit HybB-like protein